MLNKDIDIDKDKQSAKNFLNKRCRCMLHICSNHNMHSFKRYLRDVKIRDKQGLSKKNIKIYLGLLSRMMTSVNYDSLLEIYYHLCVVSTNESKLLNTIFYKTR